VSERIEKVKRRQIVELLCVMAAYLGSVFATVSFAKVVDDKFILAFLAMIPALIMGGACWVMYRSYRRMDERQQQIQAKAAGITLIAAIIAATAIGFLKSFDVFVAEDDMLWFVSFLIIVWSGARRFLGEENC